MTLVIETIKIRDKIYFENLLKHTDKKEGICRGKTKVKWECWGQASVDAAFYSGVICTETLSFPAEAVQAKEMDTSPQNWIK